jgi:2-polyprenyl-6-methoxyphenol hydroxylase-like FAD-dependent oxidoreductase
MERDVVVVGGSIAGCTAARLYARAGLRVALVEQRSNPNAHKTLCGHYIQPSAVPTIRRLGLDVLIEDAGGVRNGIDVHTHWGVIEHRTDTYGYSVRRSTLDPMLRKLARSTPGVSYLGGHTVTELLVDGGVVAKDGDGAAIEIGARLVVGADGRNSTVAELAGATTKQSANERFVYMAYFRGTDIGDVPARLWVMDGGDTAIASRNEDSVTLLALFLSKERLAGFKTDRDNAFRRFWETVRDGPGTLGTQASKLIGYVDYPVIDRPAVPRAGVALIGDAAHSADPLMAIGCGWAFQTAAWLVDATADTLRSRGNLSRALRRYGKIRHSNLAGHQTLLRTGAKELSMNPIQRLLMSGAAKNRKLADAFHAFAAREVRVRRFINPRTLARAAVANWRA